MLQFKVHQDLDSHPSYPLVQDLIICLIVNFFIDRPYYPYRVVSGKAVSSAPQHLVSVLDHERKFGDAGGTVR